MTVLGLELDDLMEVSQALQIEIEGKILLSIFRNQLVICFPENCRRVILLTIELASGSLTSSAMIGLAGLDQH